MHGDRLRRQWTPACHASIADQVVRELALACWQRTGLKTFPSRQGSCDGEKGGIGVTPQLAIYRANDLKMLAWSGPSNGYALPDAS